MATKRWLCTQSLAFMRARDDAARMFATLGVG